ncbi:EAL domain-containing protein [Motilibacter deserti]|uniref:EAL domain-containing protein n=1 Tax=Motilibacter deserti TaxID=2714956 RepID=A0ABX0GXD7_9ACTN|nr:EAL domain-containing protein [Motilibacter deserti]NHC15250.1 EAL domain-containing protein [Motilibacter deserti]
MPVARDPAAPGPARGGAGQSGQSSALSTLHRLVRDISALPGLQPTLEAVSDAAVQELGFSVATLSLVQPSGDLRTVAVSGSDDARAALLGSAGAREDWEALLASARPVGPFGSLCFLPAGSEPANDLASWQHPEPRGASGPDRWDAEDILFAPLRSARHGLLGVLCVDLPPGARRPEPAQLELLEAFATQAALAIDNAQLVADAEAALSRELRARERQQAAVAELGQAALTADQLAPLLRLVVGTVAATLDAPMASLIQCVPDGLQFAASYGTDFPPGSRPTNRGITAQALAVGAPVVVTDHALRDPDEHPLLTGAGIRSSAVTVVGGARPWGVLAVHSRQVEAFGEEALHFLQAVSNVVAAAVERFRVEAEVRYSATHDALTDLPNRGLLHERMSAALAADAAAGASTALLLIDLDGFKDVNDSLGHQAGDVVLGQVATRLRQRVRHDDVVARLGGDEFAVGLPALKDSDDAITVAAGLYEQLLRPFDTPAGPVLLGGSIGIAIAPRHGTDTHTLLKHADLAMYRAKRERTGWAAFDPRVDEDASARLGMVNDLRAAIEEGELTVAYQPVVDLETATATGAEALVRWSPAHRGPQSPASFVPLAEQSGLIAGLTDFVLRSAAGQAAAWEGSGRRMPVAVNLSGAVLADPGYPAQLTRTLRELRVAPSLLKVEVTETTLVNESAVSALRRVNAMGIRVAVDDFGTGYSSLGRLKQLPVQTLKIDRSFVTGLPADRRDIAIVRSIVALADELGMNVIAEGVETEEVARLLWDLGVRRGQGYLFARPMPAVAFEAWHDRWLRGDRADWHAAVA